METATPSFSLLNGNLIQIALSLVFIFAGYLLGYFLGKKRDHEKFIKEKRIAIYSDLILHIHTDFSYQELSNEINAIDKEIKLMEGEIEKRKDRPLEYDSQDRVKEQDLKELYELSNQLLDIKSEYYKLKSEYERLLEIMSKLSKARLVASKKLESLLRKYYELIRDLNKNGESEKLNKKLLSVKTLIEQEMRREISGSRTISLSDIYKHIWSNNDNTE